MRYKCFLNLGNTCCPTSNYTCDANGACQCPLVDYVTPDCVRVHGDCNSTTSESTCTEEFKQCVNGQCVCIAGYTTCGTSCCFPGFTCQNGQCFCDKDNCGNAILTIKGDSCVDLQNDNNNCGTCRNVCPTGKICVSGSCVCPPDRPRLCGNECRKFCPGSSFGSNNVGQVGDGTTITRPSPTEILLPGASFMQLDGGYEFSVGLTNSHVLYFWGENPRTSAVHYTPIQFSDTNFTQVCAGYYFVLALSDSGSLYGFGTNAYGQLGTGNTTAIDSISEISTGISFVQIACGFSHSFGLTSDGTLYSWGYSDNFQLGRIASPPANYSPAPITNFSLKFKQVATESISQHSCGVSVDDRIYCWGRLGQLDARVGNGNQLSAPVFVPGSNVLFKQVAVGDSISLALSIDNQVYIWGFGLAMGSLGTKSAPTLFPLPSGLNIIKVATGWQSCFVLDASGDVYVWGGNSYGQLGLGTTITATSPVKIPNAKFQDIFGGFYTNYGI